MKSWDRTLNQMQFERNFNLKKIKKHIFIIIANLKNNWKLKILNSK